MKNDNDLILLPPSLLPSLPPSLLANAFLYLRFCKAAESQSKPSYNPSPLVAQQACVWGRGGGREGGREGGRNRKRVCE